MGQRELDNLKAEVRREFGSLASAPSQDQRSKPGLHDLRLVSGKELPEPPTDFTEANASAWHEEVKRKCPNTWAEYQDRLRQERTRESASLLSQLKLLAQLLLAFVSAAGTLDISERILKESILRLAGQDFATQYYRTLNVSFYGPVAIVAAGFCLWKMLAFARPRKRLRQ